MKKIFLIVCGLVMCGYASENKVMYDNLIQTKFKNNKGEEVHAIIARELPVKCREIPFEPKNLWEGSFALDGSDKDCKKTYITTVGKLSPIKMDDNIETYGELEVLEFLEDMSEDEDKIFIDARKAKWYKSITIPGAVNIPFVYFTEKGKWEIARKEALEKMGVSKKGDTYDFSKAKTILLFCNGIWCRQSPQMIEELQKIGYPDNKMKWYRGGLQSWSSVGLTTYRPVPPKPKQETIKENDWFEVVVMKFEKIWSKVTN